MPRRKTHEEFQKQLYEINPNIELVGNYINKNTPIKCRCKKDGYIWDVLPYTLLRGIGCRKCYDVLRTKTHETFVHEVSLMHPNIEVIGSYVKSNSKILCRCNTDGYEWSPTPNSLLSGRGCPRCSRKERKTHDKFVEEMSKIHPSIVLLEEYVNSSSKILCKCKIDEYEWRATPNSLLSGCGCPKCSGKAKKTQAEFLSEMHQINPDITIIGSYTNAFTKIECECKRDLWRWKSDPHSLLKGEGCPKCNRSKGETSICKYLESNKVKYVPQKKFNDLRGIGNRRLSYDFYLPDYNLLIEYQGEFHDGNVKGGFQSTEQLQYQQEHDSRKRSYAHSHNIKLLEIWYWDFDNIAKILEKELTLLK